MLMESAKEAGIKLVTKFNMKDVAALKAELPWDQVRMLKRSFLMLSDSMFSVLKNRYVSMLVN